MYQSIPTAGIWRFGQFWANAWLCGQKSRSNAKPVGLCNVSERRHGSRQFIVFSLYRHVQNAVHARSWNWLMHISSRVVGMWSVKSIAWLVCGWYVVSKLVDQLVHSCRPRERWVSYSCFSFSQAVNADLQGETSNQNTRYRTDQ